MLFRLEKLIGGFSDLLGIVAGVLLVLLLFNVFYDVVMRYLFNDVSIGMQELEHPIFKSQIETAGWCHGRLERSKHVLQQGLVRRAADNLQIWRLI